MTIRGHETVRASENERQVLQKLEKMLNSQDDVTAHPLPTLVNAEGESIEIPLTVFQVLRQTVYYMTHDIDFSLMPYDQLLSTQEAADLLNMSRPSLIKVLEEGEIPYIKVGTHRRIQYGDAMKYKKCRHGERLRGLQEMAHLSEDLGLY